MLKRILAAATLVLFLAFISKGLVNGQQTATKVLLNNKEITSDVKIINGKPYVEASGFSDALGLESVWDNNQNVLRISGASNDAVIPEIIKNTSPCVVGIIGTYKPGGIDGDKYSDNIVHGTGIIIKAGGEILTNAHVIKDMDKIVVVLSNGDGYLGQRKYYDEESDLAVVKIGKSGLPVAKFGKDSEIVTGKTVIAIGTPISFSLRNSASTGIISGVNRGVDSYYRLIQTDAAINPGNSGGPLVSLQGNIIGVNSSKFSGEGIEGLCFSIPVSTISYVLSQFDKYGYVNRPYLGAIFTEDWAARVGLPSNAGLTVSGIDTNSPAQLQGLKSGDIVVKVGTVAVNTIVDYNEAMKKYMPADKEDFLIKRDGVSKKLRITFGKY